MKFRELHIKDKIAYILCVASFVCGTILTFCGIYLKPIGEIHSSVITSLGLFLSFSATLIGINTHYSAELTHFKTEVKRTIESKQKQ